MTKPCWIKFYALATIIAFSCSLGVGQDSKNDELRKVQFFSETVHPILEARCFKCHGGETKLKGHFRITSREGLLRGGDLGAGYDADDWEKSQVLSMLTYDDDDHQMPPKAKLPENEIAVLTKWVEQGAVYDSALEIEGSKSEGTKKEFTISDEDRNWWAYRSLSNNSPPKVSDPAWAKNPIDAFVFSKLKEAGMSPNEIASPVTLIRRVTYDLIGLPPEPEEVSIFEKAFAENADAAYGALIDDLLARPEYGEKWARHWLDVVRYAESNGFERDNPKPEIWRYRDYVINAFNEDKPYNQFVIEQLAGDEILEPTQASVTATGFHRLMQWDDEPADRKQHAYDVLADNVLVTSEAFLGMTLGCARCHDHKKDPISQKDYYSFMAFFHGVTPYETPGTIRPWAEPAVLAKFQEERGARVQVAQGKVASLEAEMTEYLKKAGKLQSKGAEKINVETFVDDARATPATWSYITKAPAPGWKEVGTKVKNWFKAQAGFGTKQTPNTYVTTEWKEPEIWMRTNFGAKEIPETLVLELYHDEDVEVYLNGVEIYRATGFINDYQVIELGQEALAAFQTGKNVLAAHCKQTKGGQFIDMALRTGAQKPEGLGVALRRGGKRLENKLKSELGHDVAKELRDAKNEVNRIQREYPGTPLNVVKESGPKPLPLHVHLRGSAHAPGEKVVPAFPSVLSGGDEPSPAKYAPVNQMIGPDSSGRRLALAKWIASPDNPLTSRVIMNRLWQHHFGRGIVASTNDFGQLGERPTHPELLTYLAAELIDRGWSLKQMHKLIMTSNTSRMPSSA